MGNEKNTNGSVWYALSLAWELGYLIALPISFFAFTGAYLDKKYGHGHWFLALGFVLAVITSGLAVYRKVKNIS